MKRKFRMVLCLLLVALTLTACSGGDNSDQYFPEMTQNLGPSVPTPDAQQPALPDDMGSYDDMADPNGQSIFDSNPYDAVPDGFTEADAMDEENFIDPNEPDSGETLLATEPEGTVYPYAGSTPIPLDPLDMPSPTPRPELSFTYAPYTAASVGVTFEGPVGWQVDETQPQIFNLFEPDAQVKDGQQCVITLSGEPVTGNYSENDLKSQVMQRLDMLAGSEFTDWKPSYTATRYMLGSKGVYANYTATRLDGTQVGGRIQYTCVDHVLYGLEIIYPLGFKDDYMNVFGQIRNSLKVAK